MATTLRRCRDLLSPCPLQHYLLSQNLLCELQQRRNPFGNKSQNMPGREAGPFFSQEEGSFDPSCWRTIDSRKIGIKRSEVSSPAWTVLKVLHGKGYQAYLVGGCVRDLILKRIPKDFDVITTASLKQIKRQFRHCLIVGRRFRICQVHIQGSIIEVSSFYTIPKDASGRENSSSQKPNDCDEKDYILWKNCMSRDFTINSLFFDPINCKVYDYVGGILDLRMSKVCTVNAAQVSFKEDCARILRGLRIAGRLDLKISKETADAIRDLYSSIGELNKSRLMLELNFMLAYGAAESSLCLLKKFKLLDIILPVHAVYLADQAKRRHDRSSIMLMKLFNSADKLLAVDHPADSHLWLSLLAFHLALIESPQDALTVWTFSAILYHGSWEKAVSLERKNVKNYAHFVPEILESNEAKSDELILQEVSNLSRLVESSIEVLTSDDALQRLLAKVQEVPDASPSLGRVFVSDKMGRTVAKIFGVLEDNIKSYHGQRECKINYERLKKGDPEETRFVLGQIIMDTMKGHQHSKSLERKASVPLSALF